MQLLLCAATEFEIAAATEFIRKENIKNIDVLITGVGLMAASYALMRSVTIKRPDLILQAGVAGYLNDSLQLADIVLVKSEMIGDLGVEENGKLNSLFDLQLLGKNEFPWKNGKLSNESLLNPGHHPVVDGVTVNEISTRQDRISFYKNELGVSVESMEGAALHYVGLQEKIPFLQMRSLSNFAGERNKSKWEMGKAIAHLNAELEHILNKLINR